MKINEKDGEERQRDGNDGIYVVYTDFTYMRMTEREREK